VRGSPGRMLAVASFDADLVVLGRKSAGDAGRPRTGAIMHALLNHARSPVAIVPE
jgi:nucleotide-binding universal stress UspA family protein